MPGVVVFDGAAALFAEVVHGGQHSQFDDQDNGKTGGGLCQRNDMCAALLAPGACRLNLPEFVGLWRFAQAVFEYVDRTDIGSGRQVAAVRL